MSRRNVILTALADGVGQLASRPIYLLTMIIVPLFTTFFFIDLMGEGVPVRSPAAIVDLDDSPVSRNVVRNLSASELTDLCYRPSSYTAALDLMKEGKIYGFFMIPRDFQADAEAGRSTSITYYVNMAYFVPGTLSFKAFKQTAVTASGEIVANTLVSSGIDKTLVGNLLQPVTLQEHCIGNPWLNYSIYLSNSFLPALLELIIFQITAFSILQEVKRGTSGRWLANAGGSIVTACAGKLVPQFVIFSVVGLAMQGILYGFCHFPMNGSALAMVVAMLLFVASCQTFALFVVAVIPNLRFALSILSLTGILAFSIAAFSFPVEDMYPAVGIFSWLLPVRYYFLIYINVALNGYEVFYCRWDYVGMLLFLLLPWTMLWKLKRYCAHPVYIP